MAIVDQMRDVVRRIEDLAAMPDEQFKALYQGERRDATREDRINLMIVRRLRHNGRERNQ